MDKKDRLKFIRDFIKEAKAITIDQLFAHVPYCEKTLRRDISELNAITSYTHRGKFITLQTIPEFDINGIWFFNDIGFTKYRNSLDLIVHIIAKSKKGITKEELEKILKINISKQIQILLTQKRLHRVKLGARYCYLPEGLAKDKKRQIQLLDIEDYYDKKVEISDLIAVLKVVLSEYQISLDNLKKLAKKYRLDVPIRKIEQLVLKYDLTSKKKP
jgi:hypothetical protein